MYHSFGVKRAINFGIFTFCKFVFDINRIFHPSLRSRLNYSIYISNKLTKSKNTCKIFIALYKIQKLFCPPTLCSIPLSIISPCYQQSATGYRSSAKKQPYCMKMDTKYDFFIIKCIQLIDNNAYIIDILYIQTDQNPSSMMKVGGGQVDIYLLLLKQQHKDKNFRQEA